MVPRLCLNISVEQRPLARPRTCGDTCDDVSLGSVLLSLRFRRLWEEEVSRRGIEKASVFRVMLRFQRTRALLDVFLGCCLSVTSVLGPVSGLGRCGDAGPPGSVQVRARIGEACASQRLLRE